MNELENSKYAHRLAVKIETANRILQILPAWKQSNYNARANELSSIRFERPLTEEEQEEYNQMSAMWARVKLLRDNSDTAEIVIQEAETIETIESTYRAFALNNEGMD